MGHTKRTFVLIQTYWDESKTQSVNWHQGTVVPVDVVTIQKLTDYPRSAEFP